MLWRLLQLTVFVAVMFTGVYYKWTPNGLVLGLIAATCAFAATVLLGDLFRLSRWTRNLFRAAHGKHRADNSLPPRRELL